MSTADRIPYDHDAGAPLTVDELRRILADAPGEAIVMAFVNDKPWSGRSVGYLAQGAERVDASSSGMNPGPTVRLHCVRKSGVFLRPRPGRLVVEHGEAHDAEVAAAHEQLQQTVEDAVAETGYRGGSSMGSAGPTTTWEWEWESTDVDVVDVVAAAEAAVATLNPGTWRVTPEVG